MISELQHSYDAHLKDVGWSARRIVQFLDDISGEKTGAELDGNQPQITL